MATITSNGYATGLTADDGDFNQVSTESSLTSTQVIYTNTDGSKIVFAGTGFSINGAGALSWSSLSSVEWTSSDLGTVYETINNFAASIGGPNSTYVNNAYGWGLLTSQSNTATGSSGNDFIDVGEGTSTITLGSGKEQILTGRDNTDTFVFGAGDWNANDSIGAGPNNIFKFQNAGAIDMTTGSINPYNQVAPAVQFTTGSTTLTASGLFATSTFTVTGGSGDTVIFNANLGGGGDFSHATFTNWNSTDKVIILGGSTGTGPVTGTAQNDIFENFKNASITGGGGTDTAVFTGAHTQYQFTKNSSTSVTITDQRQSSPDGADTLTGITNFQFTDGTFSFNQLFPPPANPAPPAATTAVMVMNNPSDGSYEIYDVGGNAILAAYSLTQVPSPWSFVGLGTFKAGDSHDMLLRNTSTGAFDAYYVSGNTNTSSALVGTVGTDWNFAGTGNFDGASSLSELLLRNAGSGSFELYQIAGGGALSGSSVAPVGNNFQVKGFGNFSGSATTQMMMQDTSNDAAAGQLELYTYQPSTASFGGADVGKVGSNLTIVGMADLLGNGMSQMVMQQNNGNFWLYTYNASSNTLSGQLVGAIGSNFHVVGFGPLGSSGQDEMLMQDAAGDFEVYQYNAGLNAFVGTSMGAVGAPWVVDGIAPNATSGGATVGFAPYQSAADVASSAGGDLQGWIDAQGSSSILTPNSPSSAVAALAGQFGGSATPAVPAAEVPALPVAGTATSQMLSASLFQHV